MTYQNEINNVVAASSNRVRNMLPYADTFYDDLKQEGWAAACEAMSDFDTDQGVSVTTYLFHRVYSHMKRYAYKQIQASGTVSLNEDKETQVMPSALEYNPRSDVRLDINTMLHSLKPHSRNLVIDRFFYQYTLREMESIYGKSYVQIWHDLSNVLLFLKARYFKEQ